MFNSKKLCPKYFLLTLTLTFKFVFYHQGSSTLNTKFIFLPKSVKNRSIYMSLTLFEPFISISIFFFNRCAPDWESSEHTVYTIYWFLAGFLIPLAVILFSSAQTLHHLRKVILFILNDFPSYITLS